MVVLLVAFNLRGALIVLAPVMEQARRDTGFSTTAAGLLLTLPVLCFAAFSPVAPRLLRRWGIERVLTIAMAVLAVGVLMRLAATSFALIAGTVTVGAAIAIGNVLLPALVKRDFPGRVGLVTGAYVTVMSAGATLAAGTTILIQQASGLSWRAALALWAIPAIAAMAACLLRSTSRDNGGQSVSPVPAIARALYRDPLAWQVTVFMGLQSLIFYSSVAWVPTLFIDHGFTEAQGGLLLGVMNLVGVPASLATPLLAGRCATQTRLVLGTSVLTGAGLLGIVLQPASAPVLWMVLLGLGQGSSIGLALTLIGLRAPDSAHAAQLSSMAQSIGYLIAAFGPLVLGALHGLTGSWALAFSVTLLALTLQTLTGYGASRDRQVGRPGAP
ncbi:MAG: MFS transporter [Chloroflexota bacterium]|nr:MFS transporter [Chloroflexota bacterium]